MFWFLVEVGSVGACLSPSDKCLLYCEGLLKMICFIPFCRYGSELMRKGLAGFSSVMKAFMVLIVTALAMGETLAMAPDIIKGNQMAASVFEVLDRKTEIVAESGEEVGRVEGVIELKRVEFYYPSRPDVKIFKDFYMEVKAGTTMALVGTSGSGKSTVLALILRFYDPTAGKVMIDGMSFEPKFPHSDFF